MLAWNSRSTIVRKIFETNSSFRVKLRATGKVYFIFFKSFLLVLTKSLFRLEDWTLGYHSTKLRHFLDISFFPKILSLKSFSNSWGNSDISCLQVIFVQRFTCTLYEICPNTESFLVRIFLHLDWIRRDTVSVQMPKNTNQQKLRIWTLFTQ